MIGPSRPPCDEGLLRTGDGSGLCAENAQIWVLAATILGSGMAFLDGSVVSVALPSIQGYFAAPIADAQWITNAYTLLLGALILVGGAAGDRFGRRRMFVLGTVLFAVASALCGVAPSAGTLIAARALQGLGGALLIPNSLAIVSAAFLEADRGRAIGTWAGYSALTTALGPVLGGWLVDALSWRAIFFINLPLAVAIVMIAQRHIPESRDARDGGIDWTGGALATVGLGAIAYGLTTASEIGWRQTQVIGSLAGGVAVLALFILAETRVGAPIVPLGLFRSRIFSGANALTLFLYFALSGVFFFLPFHLIQVHGYSATETGAAFLPFTLIMAGLSRWSGGLIQRYGMRAPLVIGPLFAAAGFALMAVPGRGSGYWISFFPSIVVLGFGMAITAAPLTAAVMSALGDHYAGTASGINNAAARVAGLLAVAVLGAVAVGAFGLDLDTRLETISLSPDARGAIMAEVPKLAEADVPPSISGESRVAVEDAYMAAAIWSFRTVMLIAAALALVSALCAAVTMPRKPENDGP